MDLDSADTRIAIGISSCLLGEEVRYDGGHKYVPTIIEHLERHFRLIPFCPEVDIGLGVPREPIHLVAAGCEIRCVGTETDTLDVTARLLDCADRQQPWQRQICGYVLKRNSPSCGKERVKLWRAGEIERSGVGIYAERLMRNFPAMPVVEDESLEDQAVRDDFIRQVLAYHRRH
jgi:uncharacterized protein YbbK (DUF523 family)